MSFMWYFYICKIINGICPSCDTVTKENFIPGENFKIEFIKSLLRWVRSLDINMKISFTIIIIEKLKIIEI